MTKHEEEIKDIILEYCQGINHLEFDLEYLPEMVSRIAALNKVASSQHIMQESDSERLLMAFQQWQLDNPNDVQYNSHKECAKTFLAINSG